MTPAQKAAAKARRIAKRAARAKESLSSQSLDGRADEIREAYNDDFGGMSECGYVTDVFEDHVIVRKMDNDFVKIPYTLDADGDPVWGAPASVEVQFQAVTEAIAREAAELTRPLDLTGAKWDARILRFGESKNKWVWTREAAPSLLPLLAGAPVCCYPGGAHAPEPVITAHNGPVPQYVVGHVEQPRIEADGVYGEVHVNESQAPLRSRLLELARSSAGAGLSVDTLVGYVREGAARVVKSVKRLFSVDLVNAPSADGGLLRATAGPVLTTLKEDTVMREKMLALIKKHRPALLAGRAAEAIAALTDEELEALVEEALKAPSPAVETKKPEWAEKIERDLAVRDTQARVTEALVAATTLPEPFKAKVRKRFDGQVADAAQIAAVVKEEIDALAAAHPSGDPKHVGGGDPARVVTAPLDKLQAGMDRLFGLDVAAFGKAAESSPFDRATIARVTESFKPHADAAKDPGLDFGFSFRRAYEMITGDVGVTGVLPKARAAESQESLNWPNILANTLYRRLLMEYMLPQYHERAIASYGSAVDFRTKEVDILDYFPDIATVDPEAADYAEIVTLNDAKVSYAVAQKGNLLTITRKTIINDDLRVVQQLVGRLGRSARRTLARFIWNFWVNNSAYGPDTLAWFHATHANTGSTALTADITGANAVMTMVQQMADMVEQGSGEKLGLPAMDSLWLDVPHALLAVSSTLNKTPYFGTTQANPVMGWFGPNNERINLNPLFTDVTDWGIHVSPGSGGRESIQVDFLQGRQEPEFFLADQPTVGQAFYGDKIQYKLRYEFGGGLMDYRGAARNVVAG